MQSEDQAYFLINHKLTRGLCFLQTCKKCSHVRPQNRFTLKEFETASREIGFNSFLFQHVWSDPHLKSEEMWWSFLWKESTCWGCWLFTQRSSGQVDSPELPETPEITEMTENFTKVTKHLTKFKETLINYVWEKSYVKKQ